MVLEFNRNYNLLHLFLSQKKTLKNKLALNIQVCYILVLFNIQVCYILGLYNKHLKDIVISHNQTILLF